MPLAEAEVHERFSSPDFNAKLAIWDFQGLVWLLWHNY